MMNIDTEDFGSNAFGEYLAFDQNQNSFADDKVNLIPEKQTLIFQVNVTILHIPKYEQEIF
jgi:hypothetical protein